MTKASINEIKQRFDNDVERFSNLETGQQSTMDAPLAMDLIIKTAHKICPDIKRVLDVGCGAGNYTLKLLDSIEDKKNLPECHLLDLSEPMLQRAKERIQDTGAVSVKLHIGDVRNAQFEDNSIDIAMAAAVFHHLRTPKEWKDVFTKIYNALTDRGVLLVADLVSHESSIVEGLIKEYYAAYLVGIGGKDYKKKVFDYIAYEDSPTSVMYQLNILREVGFEEVDILHKNACFATYYARKLII